MDPSPRSGGRTSSSRTRPADQGVAAVADTGLHRQIEIASLMDEAADFAGRPGDVDQRRMPATGSVLLGHEG